MHTEASVSDRLGAEHHRLEALWKDACGAMERQTPSHLAIKSFADGLRRHIRDEEDVLFPAFEEHTGMNAQAGPTAVMRMEHRQLEALLMDLAAVSAGNAVSESKTQAALSLLLGNHDAKEEGMLYPMMDRAFKADVRSTLLARIETFRQTD
ncbi:MAG: hemerythrin domain-containing protein [Candidatus Binataceae bacterium]